jgi:outer membrane protein assembly factor BamB
MPRAARRSRTINATGTHRGRSLVRGAILLVLVTVATASPADRVAAEEPPRSVEALEAAGDDACERGWLTAAREAWMAAASRAAASHLAEAEERLRLRLAMLDRIEAEADTPASPSALTDGPRGWILRWSAPFDRGSASAGVAPVVSGGLVLWNPGSAVHAVAVADGRPPWCGRSRGTERGTEALGTADRGDADRRSADTVIFPRGLAAVGDRVASTPPGVSIAAGRGFAVVVAASSAAALCPVPALACLDLSAAAEGRLLWLAEPPAAAGTFAVSDPVAFDGPPVADFECCAVAVRGASRSPAVAAFDARDGRLLWTRPLGSAAAADGVDRGRGCRMPCLAEDMIVVATHAGTVAAFGRDGRPAWTAAYATADRSAAPANAGPTRSAAPAAYSRGRIFVAARDRGGVIALDVRTGALLWDVAGGVVDIVGMTARHVVVQGPAASPTLMLLAADTGRETARRAAGPGERSAGASRLVGRTLLWPVSTAAPERRGPRPLAVHTLDGDTLQPLAPPTILPIGGKSPADKDESGDAEPVDLAVGSGAVFVASGRRLHCLDRGEQTAGPRSENERRTPP